MKLIFVSNAVPQPSKLVHQQVLLILCHKQISNLPLFTPTTKLQLLSPSQSPKSPLMCFQGTLCFFQSTTLYMFIYVITSFICCFINSFTHSFNKYLLGAYSGPNTVSVTLDTIVKKIDKVPTPMELTFEWAQTGISK